MKKNILILGGTGAMGYYLVNILSKRVDYNVYVTSRKEQMSFLNVKYLKGNAREPSFLIDVLKKCKWDVIVDFMNWGYQQFLDMHELLLASTDYYFFLSSCRVYDYSDETLTEKSPRLLETTQDKCFIETQRYALRKARQEDILQKSKRNNFVIIRPYKSYSPTRLQLGAYEKENWLYRAMNGKDILIKEQILDCRTTLTYSYDIALVMDELIERTTPKGDTYQIVSSETMTWHEILNLYIDILQEHNIANNVSVYTYNDNPSIDELFEGGYQIKYDCTWNRSFNSQKIEHDLGHKIIYKPMRQGLCECLEEFIKAPVYGKIDDTFEMLCDNYMKKGNLNKIR